MFLGVTSDKLNSQKKISVIESELAATKVLLAEAQHSYEEATKLAEKKENESNFDI